MTTHTTQCPTREQIEMVINVYDDECNNVTDVLNAIRGEYEFVTPSHIIKHEIMNVYNTMIVDDVIDDRREYDAEELSITYVLNIDDATILHNLVQSNFIEPTHHNIKQSLTNLSCDREVLVYHDYVRLIRHDVDTPSINISDDCIPFDSTVGNTIMILIKHYNQMINFLPDVDGSKLESLIVSQCMVYMYS